MTRHLESCSSVRGFNIVIDKLPPALALPRLEFPSWLAASSQDPFEYIKGRSAAFQDWSLG
jgi:hypothetical protein